MKLKNRFLQFLLFSLIGGVGLASHGDLENNDRDDDHPEKNMNSNVSKITFNPTFKIDDVTNEKEVSLGLTHQYKFLTSEISVGDIQRLDNVGKLHNKYSINCKFSFFFFNFNKMFGEKPEGNEVLVDGENKIN